MSRLARVARHLAFVPSAGALLLACTPATQAPPSSPALAWPLPIQFVVPQNATEPIPDTGDMLRVAVGKIGGGQAATSVLAASGSEHLAEQSLRAGDALHFDVQGTPLELRLVEVHSPMMGKDTATYVLGAAKPAAATAPAAPAAPAATAPDSTAAIEALLAALEKQTTCVFIRNGSEHTAAQAAAHLRDKWDAQRREIHSVEDFIRLCGTKSSFSGKDYRIRLADGTEQPSADFLRKLAASLGQPH